MSNLSRWEVIGLLATGTLSCGSEGSFSVLTYNVAGLPEGISGSHPEVNSPKISPLLNAYDVVLMQEDFTYHAQLVSKADHPHRSEPKVPTKLVNDGLNQLSRKSFSKVDREAWRTCNGGLESGNDCLSEKGFSMSRLSLDGDLEVVLVNLHMDAGRDAEDRAARSDQITQLQAALTSSAADDALIVAGDTNLRVENEDATLIDRMLADLRLRDACREKACGDERIDRVMIRDSEEVRLSVSSWQVADEFVDEAGEDLSDHRAVHVDLHFESQ